MPKHTPIKVACAIVYFNDKILVAQRSEKMKLPLKWEFPGGKLEDGAALFLSDYLNLICKFSLK